MGWVGILLFTTHAQAYEFIRLEDGRPIRWAVPNFYRDDVPYIGLSVNSINKTQLGFDDVSGAVSRSMQRWQQVMDGHFAYDYWQGSDANVYPTRLEKDGINSVFFLSASQEVELPQGTVAYTQIWYEGESAIISEIDIVLNDEAFIFTMDPQAVDFEGTTGMTLLLDDVITHELGHALGLDHTNASHSTMFIWGWFEQSQLSCDEGLGIRRLYDLNTTPTKLTGSIVDPSGAPIFAATVTAVSIDGRHPYAAVMTDEDGAYVFEGLPAGEYVLIVEPMYDRDDNYSTYYHNRVVHYNFCGSDYFSRLFSETSVFVEAEKPQIMPTMTVSCEPTLLGTASPTTIPRGDFWFYEHLPGGTSDAVYTIEGPGYLELTALTYSLDSPLRITPRVFAPGGEEILDYTQLTPLYDNEATGTEVWDTGFQVYIGEGTHTLQLFSFVTNGNEQAKSGLYADDEPYALIIGSFRDAPPEPIDPQQNSLCKHPASFIAEEPLEGPPLRRLHDDPVQLWVPGCMYEGNFRPAILLLPSLWGLRRRLRRSRPQREPQTSS